MTQVELARPRFTLTPLARLLLCAAFPLLVILYWVWGGDFIKRVLTSEPVKAPIGF